MKTIDDNIIFVAEYMGIKPGLSKPKEGYYLSRRILLTQPAFMQVETDIEIRTGVIPVSPDKVLLNGAFYAMPNILCVAVAPMTRVMGMTNKVDYNYVENHSPNWRISQLDYTEASTALKELETERRDELAAIVRMSETLFQYFCEIDFEEGLLAADTPIVIDMMMTLNANEQFSERHDRIEMKDKGREGLEAALFLSEHWRYIASECVADAYSFEIFVGDKRVLKYAGRPKEEGSTDGTIS